MRLVFAEHNILSNYYHNKKYYTYYFLLFKINYLIDDLNI